MSPVKTNKPNGSPANGSAVGFGALRRRVAPSVPLTLALAQADGPPLDLTFRLAFDFNAMAAVEDATGLNMLRGEIWTALTGSTLGALFWASLLAHQPEYAEAGGLEVARSYIEPGNVVAVGNAVEDAFMLSLPEDDRAAIRAARESRPARPTTPTASPKTDGASAGSNSGPSVDTTSGLTTTNSVA